MKKTLENIIYGIGFISIVFIFLVYLKVVVLMTKAWDCDHGINVTTNCNLNEHRTN